jgi:hypothetical protein
VQVNFGLYRKVATPELAHDRSRYAGSLKESLVTVFELGVVEFASGHFSENIAIIPAGLHWGGRRRRLAHDQAIGC